MYPHSSYNREYRKGPPFFFFIPIMFFMLFIIPNLIRMPFWVAILMVFILLKFFKFGIFRYHQYSYSQTSRQDHFQDQRYSQYPVEYKYTDVPVEFDNNNELNKQQLGEITNAKIPSVTTQFCIECGIKLSTAITYCDNCGTQQKY